MSCEVRFCDNNMLLEDYVTLSSESSTYSFSNSLDTFVDTVFKFQELFIITSSINDKFYYDSSSVTLTAGSYTGALLATEIQTKLNAASSGWTVSYTNKIFTIARSSSSTLNLSTTTNAVWDTIGFVSTTDTTGTSFTADEVRAYYPNHTVLVDFGHQVDVTFFAMLGNSANGLYLSQEATVTLQANNVDLWTSPPLDQAIPIHEFAMFTFLETSGYRYYKLTIEDKKNTNVLQISNFCLGDYTTAGARAVSKGIVKSLTDQSDVFVTESGVVYYDEKKTSQSLENLSINFLLKDERKNLEKMFYRVGRRIPIYIFVDPDVEISWEAQELAQYGLIDSDFKFTHIVSEYFSLSFNFKGLL